MRSIPLTLILFCLFTLLFFTLDIAQPIESSPSASQPPSPMTEHCPFCGAHPKSLNTHQSRCKERLKEMQLGCQRSKEQKNRSRAAASADARAVASVHTPIASTSTSKLADVVEDRGALSAVPGDDVEMHIYEPPLPPIIPPVALPGNRRILRSSRRQPPIVTDILPETAMPLPRTTPADSILDSHDGPSPPAASTVSVLHRIRLVVRDSFTTASNKFGLTRVYRQRPLRIPDSDLPVECVLDDVDATDPTAGVDCTPPETPDNDIGEASLSPWFPFPNFSVFQLMKYWWARGPTKSKIDRDALLAMLRLPDFNNADLDVVKDWDKMDALMDKATKGNPVHRDSPNSESIGDGWILTTIPIQVPLAGKSSSQRSADFVVPGFHRRRIMSIIRDVLTSNPAAKGFHFEPFRQYWTSPTDPTATTQRVYDELYSSDAFNTEHEALQRKPRPVADVIPRAIAALMLSSDSTHLTSFGSAKIWPLYLAFGNQTKYERARPSEYAMHHLAYLPSLPDTFQDFVKERSGVSAKPAIVTLCHRLLMHGALQVLLDDEFVDAYDHGLVIKCADGVVRRIYPRIFTYSADYPEKVLLATIRDMGTCPCPRCFVQKAAIDQLGTVDDTATRSSSRQDTSLWRRKVKSAIHWIGMGYVVGSKRVENLLHAESWVPVENAFSSRLSRFGFNLFSMLVVDILHELDLGVWKSLFTHLVRMLEAQGPDKLGVANYRFRHVPPFGVDTIRRFRNDVTAMRKLAGRDFEDILLCAIPVLEDLFPEPYNEQIMSLLFTLAYWYSLAKLRMHLSSTLRILLDLTADLGASLRSFRDEVCSKFNTHETTREYQARHRRALKQNASTAPGRAAKGFNLSTFKLHSLGDYVKTIRAFGTTDSYSTQTSELAHKFSKSRYARTNKNDAQDQIAKLERWEYFLRQMDQRTSRPHPVHDDEAVKGLPDPEAHHFIAKSRRAHFQLFEWLYQHADDPAIEFFTVRLQDYLLSKLRGSHYEGNESSFTAEDREAIDIRNDTIFTHNIAHFNYTTYDVRRARDIINLRPGHPELPAKRDIMVIANEDNVPGQPSHPFWYARVLGIFHVDARDTSHSLPHYRRQEMLWVRWYGRDVDSPAGWDAKRLDQLGFEGFGPEHPEAFGFLDPAQVLRGAHIVPGFTHGRDLDGLPASSLAVEDEGDWNVYYVNRFADRDMVMRYMGGGVGHALQLQPCDFGANPPQQHLPAEEAELLNSTDDPLPPDESVVEMDDATILGGEGDDLEDHDELLRDDLEHDWDMRSGTGGYSDDGDEGYESEDDVFSS